ncbi:MAG: hypothetical protein IKM04_00230 [Clostridia bacterium]|nr:hypothetical protein [Clostridia bacterium]
MLLVIALSAVSMGRLTVRAAPEDDLVFIVTGYRVLPIDPGGLPYYSEGTLMVPASVFSQIGISVSETRTSLIIANFDRLLYYTASSSGFTDGIGQTRPENRNPVYKNGRWFVSASFVSEEMGVNYEYVSADPYPFIRISQNGSGSLSTQFLQSYTSIASAYAAQYLNPSSSATTAPPSSSNQTEPPPARRVCLVVDNENDLISACNMLLNAEMTALLSVNGTELFSDLRTAAIAGFGFCLPHGRESSASQALYKAVFFTPRLVLCPQGQTPSEGYIAIEPDMTVLSGSSYELADLSAMFDRAQGQPVVLLVKGTDALSNLISFLKAENAETLLFTDAKRY